MSPTRTAPESLLLVVRTREVGPSVRSLEEAARLAGIHPDLLRHYCQTGILGRSGAMLQAEPRFDDDALFALLRFEHYRRSLGLSRRTARLICDLHCEVESLRSELRFRREAQP